MPGERNNDDKTQSIQMCAQGSIRQPKESPYSSIQPKTPSGNPNASNRFRKVESNQCVMGWWKRALIAPHWNWTKLISVYRESGRKGGRVKIFAY